MAETGLQEKGKSMTDVDAACQNGNTEWLIRVIKEGEVYLSDVQDYQ